MRIHVDRARRSRTRLLVACCATAIAAVLAVPTAASGAPPADAPGQAHGDVVTMTDVMSEDDWSPATPEKWAFPGDEVILTEPGEARPGPRRPFEYAHVTTGPVWGSFELDVEVRIDEPTTRDARDAIIVFGYQSDTEFYYAHLSQDNLIEVHNGIFKVDNADRVRIDDGWDGTSGPPPAITDQEYHHVSLHRDVDTGDIAVYVDGADEPLLTATDTTFDRGRVGYGSFDSYGRIRNLTVTGTPVPCLEPDERAVVHVGDVATSVANHVLDDGCAISDHVDDGRDWASHGVFVRHVRTVGDDLLDGGVIDGGERAELIRAAGRSDVGRR
jgi:hypothetical protein